MLRALALVSWWADDGWAEWGSSDKLFVHADEGDAASALDGVVVSVAGKAVVAYDYVGSGGLCFCSAGGYVS